MDMYYIFRKCNRRNIELLTYGIASFHCPILCTISVIIVFGKYRFFEMTNVIIYSDFKNLKLWQLKQHATTAKQVT